MISGIDQLEQLERNLEALAGVRERAAARCAPELLKLAQSEYSAGESAEGVGWDPLKEGSGTPLRALTSQITSAAEGASVVITTPDELKYHQGGFVRPVGAAGKRLREAQADARTAKTNADAEGLRGARKRVREIKKVIKATATPVAARPTLPRSRRALPVAWGRVIAKAWEDEMEETMHRT